MEGDSSDEAAVRDDRLDLWLMATMEWEGGIAAQMAIVPDPEPLSMADDAPAASRRSRPDRVSSDSALYTRTHL